MTFEPDESLSLDWPEIVMKIRARTPARLIVGRAGAAYRTGTQLELRTAHANARDAVRAELELEKQLGPDFVRQWGLFEVCTRANSKDEFLLQPPLGRSLSEASRSDLLKRCSSGNDLQFAVGDGLSVAAVSAQVPKLLPLLYEGAKARGWTVGQTFVIRHCRVGILNEIGEMLAPTIAILLIGERPGLATADSLSAYLSYRPLRTHTDANRNLISNIHDRGVRPDAAANRILNFAAQMMRAKASGSQLREELPALEK
jgi:ethanolamine ammonia-lyase small subunit